MLKVLKNTLRIWQAQTGPATPRKTREDLLLVARLDAHTCLCLFLLCAYLPTYLDTCDLMMTRVGPSHRHRYFSSM